MRSISLLPVAFAAACFGCASTYVTPGGGAKLAQLERVDRSDIRREIEREPAAAFPSRLALARIQAPDYRSFTIGGGGVRAGDFEVLTVQELIDDGQIEAIGNWPEVAGVSPVNRLLMPPAMNGLDDLRLAAAKLRADVLVLYTIDTRFEVRRKSVAPTGVISLGLAPDRDAQVVATASALLVDVRTGFVYGAAEATAKEQGLASYWSSAEQLDRKRVAAEERAFDDLVGALEKTWRGVVREHADGAERAARDSAG